MKRLFVGTSFSGHVNYETGQVNPDFRKEVEGILGALRDLGKFTVFCAVEHENWIVSDEPPEVGIEKDLKEIDDSDIVLVILPTGLISGGLQYELGHAGAKEKQVFIATDAGAELGYFNQGVVNSNRAQHIIYDGPESLAQQIDQATN